MRKNSSGRWFCRRKIFIFERTVCVVHVAVRFWERFWEDTKQDFLSDLQSMFDYLVDLTELICQNIDQMKISKEHICKSYETKVQKK